MDHRDADFYSEKIRDVETNENSMIDLIKDQSKVVLNTIQNFNNTLINLHINEQILMKNIKLINEDLDKTKSVVNFIELKLHIDETVLLYSIMIHELDKEVTALTSAILMAQKGVLHPAILTPPILISEFQKIQSYLPQGLDFPIQMEMRNAYILLSLIKLNVFFSEGKLVYIIYVPLLEAETFTLYKVNPLPVPFLDNKFIFILPTYEYLAIDEPKLKYVNFKSADIKECMEIYDNKRICKQKQPILVAHLHESCEVQLLSAVTKIPQICEKRIIEMNNTLFIQLETTNTWLYVTPKMEILTVTCIHESSPKDIILKGNGKISIAKNCRGFGNSAILIPQNNINSELSIDFVPKFNINEDCCDELTPTHLNLSNVVLSSIPKGNFHIDDLKIASHKLEEISRMADDLKKDTLVSYTNISYSTMGIILALVVVLYVAYKVIRKCCYPNICITIKQHFREREHNPITELQKINSNTHAAISSNTHLLPPQTARMSREQSAPRDLSVRTVRQRSRSGTRSLNDVIKVEEGLGGLLN